jgi:hypothetical protein
MRPARVRRVNKGRRRKKDTTDMKELALEVDCLLKREEKKNSNLGE